MPRCRPTVRIIPVMVSWSTLIIFTTIFFACSSNLLCNRYSFGIIVYEVIVLFFVIVFFCLSMWIDPGIYPRASDDEQKSSDQRAALYNNIEIRGIAVRMKWCQTCKFYRPPRSSHCSVCDSCIEVFDHHCPWVNNCVGRRNYRYFYFFLFTLTIHIINIIAFSLLHIISTRAEFSTPNNILLIVDIIISAILFVPIFGLTVFHTMLVARGRTTNEQVTGKFKGGYNPFDLGCFTNCRNSFCKSLWPRLSNWQSKDYVSNMKLVYESGRLGNGHAHIEHQKQNGYTIATDYDRTMSSMTGDSLSRVSLGTHLHNRTQDSDSSNRLLLPSSKSTHSLTGIAAMSAQNAALKLNDASADSTGRLFKQAGNSGSFYSLSGTSALGTPPWGTQQGSAWSINSKLDSSTGKIIESRTPSQRRSKRRAISAERGKGVGAGMGEVRAPIATEELVSPSSLSEDYRGVLIEGITPVIKAEKIQSEKNNWEKKAMGITTLKSEPYRSSVRKKQTADLILRVDNKVRTNRSNNLHNLASSKNEKPKLLLPAQVSSIPTYALEREGKTQSTSPHNVSQQSIDRQMRGKLEWRKPGAISTAQNYSAQSAWVDPIVNNAHISLNLPSKTSSTKTMRTSDSSNRKESDKQLTPSVGDSLNIKEISV